MKRDTTIVASVLAAIAGVILSSSVVCAWAVAHGASMRWRLLFRLLCHGIPDRCLYLWNVPMPICARCTAIYAGLVLSVAIFLLLPRLTEAAARMTLVVAVIPMAIDGLTQLARLRESTNGLRVGTGLAAGVAFGFWALTAVETHVFTDS